ncbi:MAG TPA: PA14 domain-containing protein [Planctomycetota bacterium]|nr:PA14 domain-containing protein [Planctomycetota bacterium]
MKGLLLAVALLAAVPAAVSQEQDEMKPGLVAEFFNIGKQMEEFPAIPAERKPDYRRIDGQINYEETAESFPGTQMSDHFYVRWTGKLKIPRDGKMTFFTESDDGSRLWIDGKLVVDNGGLHAMEEKSGELDLKAGDHDLKIELFENDGDVGCKLSWESSTMTKEILPESALLHKKDKDLDK